MTELVGTQSTFAIPELRVGSISGVPAVWAPTTSGLCTAAIMFRVGQLDEALHERGWTHLIEHLALNHLKDEPFAFNGATGVHTTTFHARGTAEEMARFLSSVTAKLHYLPYDRVEQETKILKTEHCGRSGGLTSQILMNLYGATGPGLLAYPEYGTEHVAPQKLEAWRSKYFTKSNAYIWFTGPTPLPEFAIGLPVGDGAPATVPEFAPVEKLPMWTNEGAQCVSVSALVDDVPALGCALHVLERRITERLRHQAGLSYSVQTSRYSCGVSSDMVVLVADHREGDAEEVQQFMDSELKNLIAKPASTDEIAQWRSVIDRFYQYELDSAAASSASEWAENSLLGFRTRTPAQVLEDCRSVTTADVANCIKQVLANAAWGMPQGSQITDRRIFEPSAPTWRAQGELFLRAGKELNERGGTVAVILGTDGVSIAWSNKNQQSVRFGQLALARHEDDGSLSLIERTGFSVTINPTMWRDGHRLLAETLTRIPHDRLVGKQVRAEAAPDENGIIVLTKTSLDKWDDIALPEPAGYKTTQVKLPNFTEQKQPAPDKLPKSAFALTLIVPTTIDPKQPAVSSIETTADTVTLKCTSRQLVDQIRRRALAATWASFDVEPERVNAPKENSTYFDAWSLSQGVTQMLAACRANHAEAFLQAYRSSTTDEQSIALWKLLDDEQGPERLMYIAGQYGDTSIANTIRGTVAIHYAWEARGSGWGNTVSAENAQIFLNCLRDADRLFERAVTQDPQHVLPRVKMLITARGLTMGMKERRQRYADIVAIEPTCYTAAMQYVQAIAPKWGGDIDELLAFGQKLLDTYGYGHPLNAIVIDAQTEVRGASEASKSVKSGIANQTAIRRQMIESLSVAVTQRPEPLTIIALNAVTCMAWTYEEQVLVNRGFEALKGRITSSPWTNYKNPVTPQTAKPKSVDVAAAVQAINSTPTHTGPGKSKTKKSSLSSSKSLFSGGGGGLGMIVLVGVKVWLRAERARGRG